jgi:hypothetical protein
VETEGGDWHHDEDREPGTEGPSYGRLIIGLLIGIALVLALTRPLADRLVLDEGPTTGLRLELYPGSPGITLGETSLYPKNDPWSAWLANEASCPGGEETVAPAAVQVQVLLCLVNYAREYEGVQPVALSPLLSTTAAAKARDILLCHDFSHEAHGGHLASSGGEPRRHRRRRRLGQPLRPVTPLIRAYLSRIGFSVGPRLEVQRVRRSRRFSTLNDAIRMTAD